MLSKKLGNQAENILSPRVIKSLRSEFERITCSYDQNSPIAYAVNIGLAPDIPEIELEDGLLKLSSYCSRQSH